MNYRYSADVGDGNNKMRVRFNHSETGPKNIAFLIEGEWVDVAPETYYEEDSDAWFMTWTLPTFDDDGHPNLFAISYSTEDNDVWFYLDDEVYAPPRDALGNVASDALEDADRRLIRGHIYAVVNNDDQPIEVDEGGD